MRNGNLVLLMWLPKTEQNTMHIATNALTPLAGASARPGRSCRPDIDGLRAIAITSFAAFHVRQ